MKYILAILLFSMTFSSIAKTPVSTAVIDTVLSNENVTYKVTQDESNIYLDINTSDEKTMMSMVRLGVTVFFDIKGKKKENVYVKYPCEPPVAPKTGRDTRERNTPMDIQDDDNRGDRIKAILENDYSQKAEYGYFDDGQEFNILLNNIAIEVAMTYNDTTKSLGYNLTIPKTRINTDAKKDLSELTIGVKTVKEKKKDSGSDGLDANIGGLNVGGGQRGQGRGGNSGGRGGRGNGGSRGGQGGDRPNSERQTRPTEVLLDFWFDFNNGA